MTREWCVIFNPTAGRNRAQGRLERWRHQLGDRADFRPSERSGHARELAAQAAQEGYSVVAAAGGDGTVHEVLNGLLVAERPHVRLGLLPIGSANDFAYSFRDEQGCPPGPESEPIRWIDVGEIRAPDQSRAAYFGCCAGLGFNASVTVESRRLRRLQGLALYGVAALRALWHHFRAPPWTITLDGEAPWQTDTLLFSVLNGKREGNFPLAPHASLEDGWFDFLHAGPLTRWEVLRLLPRLATSGPPADYPRVRQGRCRTVSLQSATPLICHVDGEFFCLPEDDVRHVDIRILHSRIQVDLSQILASPPP